MPVPLRKGRNLEKLRQAGKVASDILQETASEIKAGVSTLEIDQKAIALIKKNGCRSAFYHYKGFPGNICISLNEEVVHGIGAPERIIQEGDIVKIDVGIFKDGWVGDNALTVPVGTIRPDVEALLRTTEESLHAAIAKAQHGGRLGDLSHSVEKYAQNHGYTVVREFVGHGVGRKLHEEPQVPNYGTPGTGLRLKAGMVLAIEPMVNQGTEKVRVLEDDWTVVTQDARPSAHYEHMVLITREAPEILTPRPRMFL